jgi:hypothetical protein
MVRALHPICSKDQIGKYNISSAATWKALHRRSRSRVAKSTSLSSKSAGSAMDLGYIDVT